MCSTVRSKQFTSDIWNKVPPIYKESLYKMLDGGVKITTNKKYMDVFLEFWRTMRRLGLSDVLVWTMPINDTIIEIYIIDCILIRPKPNVWPTMRGKLRGIDYVAQLCGYNMSWSKNPAFEALCKYAKKNNPGQGSDTLPVLSQLLKQIVKYILDTRVYAGLNLTKQESALKKGWHCFKAIWEDELRWYWYLLAISYLFVGILGLRGCECYENPAAVYIDYGCWVSDLDFYWLGDMSDRLFKSNARSYAYENIHHIRIGLRNTKTGVKGKPVYLRMGRTNREIEPAILIYKIFCLQKYELPKIYKFKSIWKKRFLFAHPNRSTKLNAIKKQWKVIVEEMNLMEWERLRFHGTRKGFASSLLQCGLPLSWISYAGRWKLQAAIYAYLIHSQKDLLCLCQIFMYGLIVTKVEIDFDQSEFDLVKDMNKLSAVSKKRLSSDYLKKFDESLQNGDIDFST